MLGPNDKLIPLFQPRWGPTLGPRCLSALGPSLGPLLLPMCGGGVASRIPKGCNFWIFLLFDFFEFFENNFNNFKKFTNFKNFGPLASRI